MCPECHRMICEPGCPAYVGRSPSRGRAILFCEFCGFPIWKGDKYYSIGTKQFCRSCLEGASMDDLMVAFKLKSASDVLLALGAVSRVAFRQEEDE